MKSFYAFALIKNNKNKKNPSTIKILTMFEYLQRHTNEQKYVLKNYYKTYFFFFKPNDLLLITKL